LPEPLILIIHHTPDAPSFIQKIKCFLNLRKWQLVGDVVIQVDTLYHQIKKHMFI
jgi:hypothetical protein